MKTTDRPAILAVKHGANHQRDMERLGTLSNSGKPWRNSSDSFRGQPLGPGESISTGQMSGPELEEFKMHARAGRIEYVIRSYETPVAYLVKGEPGHASFWMITATRYSNTTSQQVGRLYVITQRKHGYKGPDAS